MKLLAFLAATTLGQVDLPGTQPGELTNPLTAASNCANCHGGYSENSAFDSWGGSMMANAVRDPIFQAALTVANQDVPGSGEYCIRCHSPRAWLSGRSDPPDGSALAADDYEGVDCDFCHRMAEEGPAGEKLIGNSQYFVDNTDSLKGNLPNPNAPHGTETAPFFGESEVCGTCHDVSNPLIGNFPIERTYTEWKNSDYADSGVHCQDCHMPTVTDKAAIGNQLDRTIHLHEFIGGNVWMPLVLASEFPELNRGDAYQRASDGARAVLASAADVTVDADPDGAPRGGPFDFIVRVENLTGHKLPTGYPEGRRCWLEVVVEDENGNTLLHSGSYNQGTARRSDDAQLRTYEPQLGVDGVVGFHFILQNTRVQDNRIPPRGFVPNPDTVPVGRTYPTLADGTLAHWDDAPYTVDLTAFEGSELRVTATLWYQSTSRAYVEALQDLNVTDGTGDRMYDLWLDNGRSAPVQMDTVSAVIPVVEPSTGGCRASQPPFWALLGLLFALRRKQQRS